MSNILLIDDDEVFCEAVSQMLELMGHKVSVAFTIAKAKTFADSAKFDHMLIDFMLPDGSGLHLVDEYQHETSITLMTGHPSVKSMMAGFSSDKVNYLLKPIRKENLEAALNSSAQPIKSPSKHKQHFDCLVGESPQMQELYTLIERVARTQANVMLMGESGAGKEVVAQAIHNASKTDKPMVAANCGAFSKELIGSELFGHEKGAFTGAVSKREGLFEQANGGSLFLDEVTEMPIEEQPNLLRVLETNKVTRVGGSKLIDIQCRVISATNRTIDDIAQGDVLREDLYFRLAVFPITIPALRERAEDISLLAETFIEELNSENGTSFILSDSQLAYLRNHDWPGNVRELRHTIHRAFIMSDPASNLLTLPKDLSSPFTKKPASVNTATVGKTIDEVEKELISVTLAELDGDKAQAAKVLGISLKTLYNRLHKYGEANV